MDVEASRDVLRPKDVRRIGGHRGRRRSRGEEPPVRPPELERAVGLSLHLVALLVDRAVVTATEQREVGERGRAALRPVADVMPLTERQSAAREAATPVPMVQRSPQRRGNRPRPGADLQQAAVGVVSHHHPAGVARQASRRFRGNARAVLEYGLARLIGVRQHRGIDVQHYLVALARTAGVEHLVKGRLRDQGERVGLLLGPLTGRHRGLVPGRTRTI